jgi:hypothetical protein
VIKSKLDVVGMQEDPSLRFLAEAQPRCTLHFLGERTNYKAKDIITFFK